MIEKTKYLVAEYNQIAKKEKGKRLLYSGSSVTVSVCVACFMFLVLFLLFVLICVFLL